MVLWEIYIQNEYAMLLLLLLIIPLIGIFIISTGISSNLSDLNIKRIKFTALTTSILNLFVCLIIFIFFDFSSNQFQFVQEYHEISSFDFYLGLDGLSIYFVLLTTIIIPISLLSNWNSISENIRSYVIIILLLETLLLAVFLALDVLLYYIFFESILPPLFILIGLFGSTDRVRASFYLFLYTLLGSLFLLLSILTMSSTMGTTDFDALFKTNFNYFLQFFLFYGIFIAFAVKTPTIFLNTWLLKAHVESPLGGSIILAAIVLKLSLYGIFRLILPLLPKASLDMTYFVYLIGVITIIYASFSTLRTLDVKELIAYSSVSHAAVYLMGVFSNTVQGIEGGIVLGLAHGLTSSGLFISVGGILYDRTHTRLIYIYRGLAQIMPLFSILFYILSLSNCATPLTLNFVGEFLSLYGIFERLSLLGVFASSSIIFSAAYTIFMFNRISFGGSFSNFFLVNLPDLYKREFVILFTLIVLIVLLGVYPAPILDGLHYSVSSLLFLSDLTVYCLDDEKSKIIILEGNLVSNNRQGVIPLIILSLITVNIIRLFLFFSMVFFYKLYDKDRPNLNLIDQPNKKKNLIKFRFSNLKQKFTLRSLFVTFIGLLIIFLLRLYLINLWGLDLNTFKDYVLLGILVGVIKALLHDLCDTLFPTEYCMDKQTEQSLMKKTASVSDQASLAEDMQASVEKYNFDLNNKISELQKKINRFKTYLFKNNISVQIEEGYIHFLGEDKQSNIILNHQYAIQVEVEKIINLLVKAEIFQGKTGKAISGIEPSKSTIHNLMKQFPIYSEDEIREMYMESVNQDGERHIHDPFNRSKKWNIKESGRSPSSSLSSSPTPTQESFAESSSLKRHRKESSLDESLPESKTLKMLKELSLKQEQENSSPEPKSKILDKLNELSQDKDNKNK